ncbi:LAETG motif-containing sortase-dependent surface protein [Streptomyces sp. NPDC020983]|uniref:LAETG motif-containing sortase-dependent surface protein n=1 Tax=Streptomyces sp. NPDC020983 TaxID=3365106 RepID=UPI0037AF6852
MSINRRTATAVRSIGVAAAAAALALGVAGNSYACTIGEFIPSAGCDKADHGYISVVDKDSSTAVDITVSQGATPVGSKVGVKGSGEGTEFTFPVEWKPGTEYTVHVVRTAGGRNAEVGTTTLKTPDKACATDTPPAQGGDNGGSPSPSASASATPSESASAVPSTSTSAPAAAVDDTNAPKPAAGGTSNLAETGGGSNTGMIAGVAAALVVAGGGTVFFLRRRKPAAHS